MQIAPLLNIGRGVTALIGGGGKRRCSIRSRRSCGKRARSFSAPRPTSCARRSTRCWSGRVKRRSPPRSARTARSASGSRPPRESSARRRSRLTRSRGSLTMCSLRPTAPGVCRSRRTRRMSRSFRRMPSASCWSSAQTASASPSAMSAIGASVMPHCAASVRTRLSHRSWKQRSFSPRVSATAFTSIKVETAEDYDRAAALANRLTCPVTAGSLHKGVYLCLR